MRNFSSNIQCAVVEELACFQYSLNYKNSNYREKQSLIWNILVSSHLSEVEQGYDKHWLKL